MTRKEDNTPRNNREKGGNGTKKELSKRQLFSFIRGAYPLYRPRLYAFRHSLSALSLAPLGPLFSLLRPLTWPLSVP